MGSCSCVLISGVLINVMLVHVHVDMLFLITAYEYFKFGMLGILITRIQVVL